MIELKNRDLVRNPGCGECAACCRILGVVELEKPPGQHCGHTIPLPQVGLSVIEGRCHIYDRRPKTCRDFECLWLVGCLGNDPDLRPDKLGLMFDSIPQPVLFGPEGGINVREVRPGALEANRLLIERLADKTLILCFAHDGKRSLRGPYQLLGPAINRMKAALDSSRVYGPGLPNQ